MVSLPHSLCPETTRHSKASGDLGQRKLLNSGSELPKSTPLSLSTCEPVQMMSGSLKSSAPTPTPQWLRFWLEALWSLMDPRAHFPGGLVALAGVGLGRGSSVNTAISTSLALDGSTSVLNLNCSVFQQVLQSWNPCCRRQEDSLLPAVGERKVWSIRREDNSHGQIPFALPTCGVCSHSGFQPTPGLPSADFVVG